MNLTEKNVAKLPASEKRTQYPDSSTTGFGVRVQPNGRKSFYWFAKVGGKPRFRALGEFPFTSVGEARAAAVELAGQAAAWKRSGYAGVDPFTKVKPVVPTDAPQFSELLDAYVTQHLRDSANNPDKAERDLRWLCRKHLGRLLDRHIDTITMKDVLTIRNALGEAGKKYMANRVTQTVRYLYAWCTGKSGSGDVRFWNCSNPAEGIESYKETPRERHLSPEEDVRVQDELAKPETHADLKDFIVLALECGVRKSNIWSARWEDIDFERKLWRVPMSKSGESYNVPLTPGALKVLKRRRHAAGSTSRFVFPAENPIGHVRTGLERQWNNFRKRCGLPDLRIHDLRRSCGSFLAEANVSLPIIAKTLGHTSLSATHIYAKLQRQAVEQAMESAKRHRTEMAKAARKRLARKPITLPVSA